MMGAGECSMSRNDGGCWWFEKWGRSRSRSRVDDDEEDEDEKGEGGRDDGPLGGDASAGMLEAASCGEEK